MADVTDMLARAEADLREADTASAAADARAAAAQAEATDKAQRAAEMRATVDWLRAQLTHPQAPARRVGQKDAELRFGRPVPENPITQLSLDALEAMGGSGSNGQVRERLARDGHDFSQGQVRAALRYLSKKSDPLVTTQRGTGMWRLTRPRQPATGFPAANGVRP